MEKERKSIRVKIFGSEYPLRGESEEFTRKVASHVDEMINSIHDKIPEQPTLTVAVLSALNVTEDLFKERAKGEQMQERIESEVGRMADYLDEVLKGN